MRIFKKMLLSITVLLTGLLLAPAISYADCANPASAQEQVQCGVNAGSGNTSSQSAPKTLNNLAATIINILSLVGGAAAVIMIIVGGFRYVTSAGNPEGAKSARNTILYAVIGLIVIAVAQIIVQFVLNKAIDQCVNHVTASGQKC